METKIKACTCTHAWQDKTYGPQKRVFNQVAVKTGPSKYRCTVCKAERE